MTAVKPERPVVRIRVTPDTSRAELAEAIDHLRTKRDRMPCHWTERRDEISDEVDGLVAEWLAVRRVLDLHEDARA